MSVSRRDFQRFTRSHSALTLLSVIIVLLILGLIAVYNASVSESFAQYGTKFHFVTQQLKWSLVGLVFLAAAAFIPLGLVERWAPIVFGFTLLLMLAALIPGIGQEFQGARRWITFGNFVLQPSELLKPGLIIYLAAWLKKPQKTLNFLAIVFVFSLLTMLQPDLGTTIVLVTIAFGMFYLSGAPLSHLIGVSGVGALLGALLIFTSEYRRSRLTTFLNVQDDPLGASYHVNQILLALGSGGLTGVGLGRSRQKHQYLPEATTDSIFAVIAEEIGFLGAGLVIVLISFLILTGFEVALMAKKTFPQLLASGIIIWIGTQALLNLAAMVALVPLTGIPLPLISYGGSSLITTLAGLGLVINVAKNS